MMPRISSVQTVHHGGPVIFLSVGLALKRKGPSPIHTPFSQAVHLD